MEMRNLSLSLISLSFLALAPSAQADNQNHACTVLMCLANPDGPKAVAECVDPIEKLYRDLHRGKPFPHCNLAQSNEGSARAEPKSTLFDPCPTGTHALSQGSFAVQGTAETPRTIAGGERQQIQVGIGEGDQLYFDPQQSRSLPQKTCVGNKVADAFIDNGQGNLVAVEVYDQVTLLDPQTSPNVIDIYMTQPGQEEQLYRRVRW